MCRLKKQKKQDTAICSCSTWPVSRIGVGAQSTIGGTKFLPEKYVLKISKMPEFYMILARKMPEFYIIIA